MKATCPECGRIFDLLDPDDADEWFSGHDCEVGVMDPATRKFYWTYLDDAVLFGDLLRTVADAYDERGPRLIGIVSERDGGIIAYAIGEAHAAEIILALDA